MSHKGSDFSGKIKYFDKLLLISVPLLKSGSFAKLKARRSYSLNT